MWGQTVIVDNRTGGNGSVGAALVARATPDGHTLVLAVSGIAINAPSHEAALRHGDRLRTGHRDCLSGRHPAGDTPTLPANDLKELQALVKKEGPDKRTFASPDPGSRSDGRTHLRQGRHQAPEHALQGSRVVRRRHLRGPRRCRHRQRHLGSGADQRWQAEVARHHGHQAHPGAAQYADLQGAGLPGAGREFLVRPVRAGRHAAGHRRGDPEGHRHAAGDARTSRPSWSIYGSLPGGDTPAAFSERFQRDIKELGETIRRLGITAD